MADDGKTNKGTVSGDSSTQSQGQAGVSTDDWKTEKARLEAEIASRDQQLRATTQGLQAWKKIGRELEGVVEYDAYGNPIKLNIETNDGGGSRQTAFTGQHPLSGIVEDPTVVDSYYKSQFGNYATKEQLQASVNQAVQQAVAQSSNYFNTLRTVEKTVREYGELEKYDSSLSKKTAEVLQRNQWGMPSPQASGWDGWQYAAPNALPLATQIARAELYTESQRTQQSQADAAAAQNAAGIAGAGGGGGSVIGKSADEMAQMLLDNPAEAEKLAKAQFEQQTSAGR